MSFGDFLSGIQLVLPNWVIVVCFAFGYLSLVFYLVQVIAQSIYSDQNLGQIYKATEGSKVWAIVTGASSGIGKSICYKLAKQSINVVMVALPDALLDQTHSELSEKYPDLKFFKVGVNLGSQDPQSYIGPIDEVIQKIVQEGGEIRILNNNAGYILPGLYSQRPLDQHLQNLNCNVTASLTLTHHVLQYMIKLPVVQDKSQSARRGLITFTSSSAAFVPTPISAVYGSTKSMLTSFAASLAVELQISGTKIDVLCVHPSPIDSNFYQNAKGVSMITAFKATAMSPDTIANTIFRCAGRSIIVDQGYFSILSKILLKALDWNFMTEIMHFFTGGSQDLKNMMAKGITVSEYQKQFQANQHQTSIKEE